MLKVANIIEDGRYAGPQARIATVAEQLKNYQVETTVIYPDEESTIFTDKLNSLGIQVKPIKLHRLTKYLPHLIKYILFFIPQVISLKNLIKKENYSLVHCNSCWQIKGVIASKLAGVKVIWHLNDFHGPKILKLLFSILANYVDGFIFTCERVKDDFIKNKYLNENILMKKTYIEIHAPVDTHYYDPKKVDCDQTVSSIGGFKIISIGNVSPRKDFETFIKVSHLLNQRFSLMNLTYIIVGPIYKSQESYKKKLKILQQELGVKNLYFLEGSNNIRGVLKAADISVCTSQYETGPMSVWESLSMEVPVVSTDVGDVAKFFNKYECGFVVPIGNVNLLAEKVSLLIENNLLREKIVSRGRRVAQENFDTTICAKQHALFYRQVLNSKN